MIRVLIAVILTLLVTGPASVYGQGFSSFNGRNHPELRWQVAQTEHFKIAYPEHLSGIEDHAAAIAEASFAVLSANLGVSFDSKIRIYLSDEDENTNGFAVPIGEGHTNIWVNVNEAAVLWTGREKWLRKVISHELAHIFHYKAVRSSIHPLNFLFSNPIPSFWTEGIAQYETELWDAYRGEQVLRTAVLDDQLSYSDGRSIRNGALRYAVGNSQLRFFAEQYGDSSLTTLLADRQSALFGLVKYHDFSRAFRTTTDESYREFYDRWRRHVNIRYNTLAGTMENADSIGTKAINIPGQYLFDIVYSPDRTHHASIAMHSIDRPIRQLAVTDSSSSTRVLAEGAIREPLSWSPDGKSIAFTRNARSINGSFINDLFSVPVEGGDLTRLTHARRATSPSFSPDGQTIAFVASSGGTGNVFTLKVGTLKETQLTHFAGDVQIGTLQWSPDTDFIAYSLFDADGNRFIETLEVSTGSTFPATNGTQDDRNPVWSPDGKDLAYTSLRDGVPNIFTCRMTLENGLRSCAGHRRVTNLVTGAIAMDWITADSTRPEIADFPGGDDTDGLGIRVAGAGMIIARVTSSKTRDEAYAIPAERKPYSTRTVLAPAFDAWTRHSPPQTLPSRIDADPSLVESRERYRPLRNLSHVVSVASPYISTSRYGIGGLTVWSEPLAKHMGYLGIGVDARDPLHESGLLFGYVNNTLRPSIETELQILPDSPRPYGKELLLERLTQLSIQPIWQIDTPEPFHAKSISLKFAFLHVEPRNTNDLDAIDEGLPYPETGEQLSIRLSYTHRFQRPWIDNLVHPLDGFGVRVRLTGAAQGLGNDQKYARLDISSYRVLPSIAQHRIVVHGRMQLQRGESLAQDFIGLSRYDDFQVSAPNFISFQSSNSERVRGFRDFVLGKAILFGTVEYRVPLTRSLDTELFGLIGFGSTSISVFADGAIVSASTNFRTVDKRLGLGVELKNAITLGGIVSFMHSVGLAQPSRAIGTDDDWEVYYRVRKTLPF